ncbi:hypothetical protein E2562_028423 [Oryza meyeriana var. granulata]|uniref:Uncharacterized protein n=1 Tax=Oryza meyeriana var. granulata TaxID=110450 RepID=A0A6G1EQP2_9ORYZ|nr:hypothetical protein E2562_028423 [Oryza meyeriana var. granulata]
MFDVVAPQPPKLSVLGLGHADGAPVVATEYQSAPCATGGEALGDAVPVQEESEEGRLRKGKMVAEAKKHKCDHHSKFFWTGLGHDRMSTSSAGSDMGASLDNIAVVDEHLRAVLKDLGASPSWHNNERGEPFPFEELVTPAEKDAANDKDGLLVQTYDCTGRSYDMKCKFLTCNDAYQLIEHWGEFLEDNHLVVKDKKAAIANAT